MFKLRKTADNTTPNLENFLPFLVPQLRSSESKKAMSDHQTRNVRAWLSLAPVMFFIYMRRQIPLVQNPI